MSKKYVVLGAGMQGVAAAYDFAKFGDAAEVSLLDLQAETAKKGANRINQLLGRQIVVAGQANVTNPDEIRGALHGADLCLSAVPYFFNEQLTRLAIEAQCNFCDLGGNTDVVFRQHAMHEQAKAAGVSIAPDCGLAPGMANILAAHGIRQINKPKTANIRVGGLPQNPKPPLGYNLVFSMEGLTNEYFGKAHALKNGKRVEIDTFSELEEMEFPAPIGRCEAFVTAGGSSTCPWTFAGLLDEFDEKTIRYPGHFEKMKTALDLGLMNLEPVQVAGKSVVPRQLFHAVVEPLIRNDDVHDVVLLRVTVSGENEKVEFNLTDYYDERAGFTAMQRTTGWGASIVGVMLAHSQVEKGCVRIEQAVDSNIYIEELLKRGFDLKIS